MRSPLRRSSSHIKRMFPWKTWGGSAGLELRRRTSLAWQSDALPMRRAPPPICLYVCLFGIASPQVGLPGPSDFVDRSLSPGKNVPLPQNQYKDNTSKYDWWCQTYIIIAAVFFQTKEDSCIWLCIYTYGLYMSSSSCGWSVDLQSYL